MVYRRYLQWRLKGDGGAGKGGEELREKQGQDELEKEEQER